MCRGRFVDIFVISFIFFLDFVGLVGRRVAVRCFVGRTFLSCRVFSSELDI